MTPVLPDLQVPTDPPEVKEAPDTLEITESQEHVELMALKELQESTLRQVLSEFQDQQV